MKSILVLILLYANLYATCVCESNISNIYEQVTSHIIDNNLEPTTNNINSDLIPKISDNTSFINEQNSELKKLLKAEKKKSVESSRIIFNLEKILKLEEVN